MSTTDSLVPPAASIRVAPKSTSLLEELAMNLKNLVRRVGRAYADSFALGALPGSDPRARALQNAVEMNRATHR